MLVLTRRIGEKFIIDLHGTRVEVMLLEVKLGRARLGIEAPAEVSVRRQENEERNVEDR